MDKKGSGERKHKVVCADGTEPCKSCDRSGKCLALEDAKAFNAEPEQQQIETLGIQPIGIDLTNQPITYVEPKPPKETIVAAKAAETTNALTKVIVSSMVQPVVDGFGRQDQNGLGNQQVVTSQPALPNLENDQPKIPIIIALKQNQESLKAEMRKPVHIELTNTTGETRSPEFGEQASEASENKQALTAMDILRKNIAEQLKTASEIDRAWSIDEEEQEHFKKTKKLKNFDNLLNLILVGGARQEDNGQTYEQNIIPGTIDSIKSYSLTLLDLETLGVVPDGGNTGIVVDQTTGEVQRGAIAVPSVDRTIIGQKYLNTVGGMLFPDAVELAIERMQRKASLSMTAQSESLTSEEEYKLKRLLEVRAKLALGLTQNAEGRISIGEAIAQNVAGKLNLINELGLEGNLNPTIQRHLERKSLQQRIDECGVDLGPNIAYTHYKTREERGKTISHIMSVNGRKYEKDPTWKSQMIYGFNSIEEFVDPIKEQFKLTIGQTLRCQGGQAIFSIAVYDQTLAREVKIKIYGKPDQVMSGVAFLQNWRGLKEELATNPLLLHVHSPIIAQYEVTPKAAYTRYAQSASELASVLIVQAKLLAIYKLTGERSPDLMHIPIKPKGQARYLSPISDKDIENNPHLMNFDLVFVPTPYHIDHENKFMYEMIAVTQKGAQRIAKERELGYPPYKEGELDAALSWMEAHGIRAYVSKLEYLPGDFSDEERARISVEKLNRFEVDDRWSQNTRAIAEGQRIEMRGLPDVTTEIGDKWTEPLNVDRDEELINIVTNSPLESSTNDNKNYDTEDLIRPLSYYDLSNVGEEDDLIGLEYINQDGHLIRVVVL